jgi:hypothetical protein
MMRPARGASNAVSASLSGLMTVVRSATASCRVGPLRGRLHEEDLCGRPEASEPAGELPDGAAAGHQHRPSRKLAGEFHRARRGRRGFDPGRLESSQLAGDSAQVPGEGGHQRCQRSIGPQAQRGLQSGLPAQVWPPRPAVHARAVHVAVGVGRDPLTDRPVGDVVANRRDPVGGLVSEDAVTPINLRQLRGVQTAAADAAQIDLDPDLIGAQGRTWPVL